MASNHLGSCSPEMNAEQLEAMLAELDEICRQARELTTSIKVQMHEQRHGQQQVVAPRRFLRLVTPAS